MNPLYWILIILGVIILYIIIAYNSLIILRNRINNAWSQIDVQLKRRADLIPNLVNTVKGYAKHEKEIMTDVTRARQALIKAPTLEKRMKAGAELEKFIGRLFAIAENYHAI